MLSNLIYFLESLHCVRSLISIIVFAVGIVLILIWKFKIKKTSLLVCSVILMIIPCIVIVHGCYSAYLRPAHMEVELTQQELADFSEYLLEDDRFLDTKSFLRNNEKWFYQEEKGKEEQIDGKPFIRMIYSKVFFISRTAVYIIICRNMKMQKLPKKSLCKAFCLM